MCTSTPYIKVIWLHHFDSQLDLPSTSQQPTTLHIVSFSHFIQHTFCHFFCSKANDVSLNDKINKCPLGLAPYFIDKGCDSSKALTTQCESDFKATNKDFISMLFSVSTDSPIDPLLPEMQPRAIADEVGAFFNGDHYQSSDKAMKTFLQNAHKAIINDLKTNQPLWVDYKVLSDPSFQAEFITRFVLAGFSHCDAEWKKESKKKLRFLMWWGVI